jgi:hypothetical protein
VVGAHLSVRVILILGGANLIADGFAMAAGNYLATRSEHEEFSRTEAIERRHIEVAPEGEREEVREILRGFGIAGGLLEQVVAAVTSDRDRWVRLMVASAATSLTFLSIGALKSRWSIQPWWQSGLGTLAIGGAAATVAFAVGAWLRNVSG